MLVRPRVHQEWELLKWMMLLALALALTLLLATGTAGGKDLPPPGGEPALLPDEIELWSAPMEVEKSPQASPEADLSMQVWKAIDAQHREDYDAAISMWKEVELQCDSEVWKYIALGQAYVATGEIKPAASVLTVAEQMAPLNPVVHYYLGLLRLEQAYVADEWYDSEGPSDTLFVAYGPREVAPNTKSMYRLAAINEFESAIAYAGRLNLYESLVPEDSPTEAAMQPTAHDLLLAMRAENFEDKSHNVLGNLYLEQGGLSKAEHHMDQAVAAGMSVVDGYTRLAERFEEVGRHADAARAYLKAVQQEPGKMAPLRKAWKNLWDSML